VKNLTKNDLKTHITKIPYSNIGEAISNFNEILDCTFEENYNLVSVAFHDLRNPLTYVKMSLDVLLSESFGKLNSEQIKFVKKSVKQIDRLNKLTNDVLLISKLENNKIKMNFSAISIRTILDDAIEANRKLAEERKINLQKEIDENIPQINIDYKYFSIAIHFLIIHAIQCTEEGSVKISCNQDSHPEKINICIKNTSPCSGEEEILHIFDKFKFFGISGKKKEIISGLELSICKKIIEQHSGKIIFSSKQKEDRQFNITL